MYKLTFRKSRLLPGETLFALVSWLVIGCLIVGSSAICPAQTAAAGSAAPASAAITGILIAEHRTASEAAKRDVVNSLMKESR